MKLAFVGGGNMATALIGGLLARGASAADIRVVDIDAGQRERVQARFGVTTCAEPGEAVRDAELVVLAVKPQQMRSVASGLGTAVAGALVVSIAAGIRARDLAGWLGGHARVVRAMPNTPALVGAGITVLAADATLAATDRDAAAEVLGAVGEVLWVEDEGLIDAVTAVSGSGPAYVFYFMEAMISAGVRLGLSEEQSRRLTLATFAGATRLAEQSPEPPSVLRERVTSKGGTTAAALEHMNRHAVGDRIVEALEAARRRSVELGDELGAG